MSDNRRSRIHESALVETDSIGVGTVIWAFAHILRGAVVGADCMIGDHVFIEGGAVLGDRVTVKNNALIWHGVAISDDVFVGPNVVFTNDLTPRAGMRTSPEDWLSTSVGDGASIGANSTILCGIELGEYCLVGAGSVVTRNVPRHALVVGNPASQVGWACRCGATLDSALTCPVCGRRYVSGPDGLALR